MTFIASVIAKNGVALVSDSLIMSTNPLFAYGRFKHFFNSGGREHLVYLNQKTANFPIEPIEQPISTMAESEAKLFCIDRFTGLSFCGNAVLNGIPVPALVQAFVDGWHSNAPLAEYSIENLVYDFASFIKKHANHHLQEWKRIFPTAFLLTHFSPNAYETTVWHVVVKQIDSVFSEDLARAMVDVLQLPKWKVVCDGNTPVCNRLLFGQTDAKQRQPSMPVEGLKEMELAEAVDFARLLLSTEMEFEHFFGKVKTIGGKMQLAVIDGNGFRFLAGHAPE